MEYPLSKFAEICKANGVGGEVTGVDVRAPLDASVHFAFLTETLVVHFKDRDPLYLFQKRIGAKKSMSEDRKQI
jgi:hypothetical protein